jgi:hypothetical protein
LTAAQVNSLIIPVLGFVLSNAANILILIILFDFSLLPAQFCHKITHQQTLERRKQFAEQRVLKTCQSHTLFCIADAAVATGGCLPKYSQEGHTQIMMSALLRVNLMLTPNQSLLNTQQALNKYTEGHTSMTAIWILHIIPLSEITPRYFAWFTKEMFYPYNIR